MDYVALLRRANTEANGVTYGLFLQYVVVHEGKVGVCLESAVVNAHEVPELLLHGDWDGAIGMMETAYSPWVKVGEHPGQERGVLKIGDESLSGGGLDEPASIEAMRQSTELHVSVGDRAVFATSVPDVLHEDVPFGVVFLVPVPSCVVRCQGVNDVRPCVVYISLRRQGYQDHQTQDVHNSSAFVGPLRHSHQIVFPS